MKPHARVKVPKAPDFIFQELVPKDVYEAFADNPLFLTNLFDPRALETLQALREAFGPCIVNTWHTVNGGFQYRGYRPLLCEVGATRSQHKLGKAFDCSFKDFSAEEVREYVLENPHLFPHITAIEADVNWFHFDVRTPTWAGIKVFKP
ncbi:D-Ala-D-Ala carboxypeptidase family metallohydrolase [Pseudoalteromonas sp. T1lg10]|uniref:D-Ala-D-Ala carboxypeptidase family metallohydrolase n=1 Tax=Pseudoalteromonas sp. T1lg10 TaxID=2077093 RepID=UPI000CF6230C|nr:D-Ala-D-Ala carboxypeptidase family metallohydrolase [Pseudoalteromonas sp. T1lg10]